MGTETAPANQYLNINQYQQISYYQLISKN